MSVSFKAGQKSKKLDLFLQTEEDVEPAPAE